MFKSVIHVIFLHSQVLSGNDRALGGAQEAPSNVHFIEPPSLSITINQTANITITTHLMFVCSNTCLCKYVRPSVRLAVSLCNRLYSVHLSIWVIMQILSRELCFCRGTKSLKSKFLQLQPVTCVCITQVMFEISGSMELLAQRRCHEWAKSAVKQTCPNTMKKC